MEAERMYLAVPYAEKDEASALGALWDREARSWYAPAGAELAPLSRWMPRSPSAPAHRSGWRDDPRIEFARALQTAGLRLEGLPEMDGRLRRAPVDGDRGRKQSGAYVGYLDGHPAGFIQNHRTGFRSTWKASLRTDPLDAQSKALVLAEAAERRQARERERSRLHEQTAEALSEKWSWAMRVEGSSHPYLERKGVKSYGLREDEQGDLLIPIHDAAGKLWSLQSIRPDGTKAIAKNSRLGGNFYAMGPLGQAKILLMAEGYATAATIFEALLESFPVAVVFGAGNLGPVSRALRAQYPGKHLCIAADDDRASELSGKPNVGRQKAEEAVRAVGGFVLLPRFPEGSQGSDWNDLALGSGMDEVRRQLGALLRRVEHGWPEGGGQRAHLGVSKLRAVPRAQLQAAPRDSRTAAASETRGHRLD